MRKIDKLSLIKTFLFLFFITILVIYNVSDVYLDRLSTVFNLSDDYNLTSSTGRVEIWKRGIDMMFNNPLLGVGVINFISAEGMLYADSGSRWNAAHNSFIQVGSELGIPGLLVFFFLIFASLRNLRIIAYSSKETNYDDCWRYTALSIYGSWIAYVVSGSLLSAAYTTFFYFILSITFVYMRLHKQELN